jgi:hypothetical protein
MVKTPYGREATDPMSTVLNEFSGRGQRNPRPSTKPESNSTPAFSSDQKPGEVSDKVWALAQYWLRVGTETWGRRPPVNLASFSTRLHTVINNDPEVKKILRKKYKHGTTSEYLTRIFQASVDIFWDSLEEGDPNDATIQFTFLGEDWEFWLERGMDRVWVQDLKKYGKPIKPMPQVPREKVEQMKAEASQRAYMQRLKDDRLLDGTHHATEEERAEHYRVRREFAARAGKVRNREGNTDDE